MIKDDIKNMEAMLKYIDQYEKQVHTVNKNTAINNDLYEEKTNKYSEMFIKIMTFPLSYLDVKPTNEAVKHAVEGQKEYSKVKASYNKARTNLQCSLHVLEFMKLKAELYKESITHSLAYDNEVQKAEMRRDYETD